MTRVYLNDNGEVTMRILEFFMANGESGAPWQGKYAQAKPGLSVCGPSRIWILDTGAGRCENLTLKPVHFGAFFHMESGFGRTA